MTFEKVITFAREEHQRYVNELMECKDPHGDPPLPHIYLFDSNDQLEVFALMMHKDPNLAQYLKTFRMTMQAKILFEGPFASVFCGVVLSSPRLPSRLQRIMEEKEETDGSFLETMHAEHGIVIREEIMVTAECASNTFVRQQRYYIRDKKVHFDGEPHEFFDRGVPDLPHCKFRWPKS